MKLNYFKKNGIVNFGDLKIPPNDIIELSEICNKIYTKIDEGEGFEGVSGFNNLIVHNIRAAQILNQIFNDKNINTFLEEILGKNFKIWDISFRRSNPGDRGLYLHQDGPGQVNMAILLDDNLKGDGATAVLRSSHIIKKSQKKLGLELQPFFINLFSFLFMPISGKIGDVCFFSNRIWHGRFKNKTKINHDVILIGFFPSRYSYGNNAWSQSLINLESAPALGNLLASSKDLENAVLSSGTAVRESKNIYYNSDHGFSINIEDPGYLTKLDKPFKLTISLSLIKSISMISRCIKFIIELKITSGKKNKIL